MFTNPTGEIGIGQPYVLMMDGTSVDNVNLTVTDNNNAVAAESRRGVEFGRVDA